jgi:uncharacterized membrane protein
LVCQYEIKAKSLGMSLYSRRCLPILPPLLMISFAHVFLSVVCLFVGGYVFLRPKGTQLHRWLGRVYAISMICLNVAALGIYHLTGHFNLFHMTAILSLILVLTGWAQVLFRHRLRNWFYRHYVYMCWSYVALLAAACNEAFVRLAPLKEIVHRDGNWVIIAAQVVLLAAAALLIKRNREGMQLRYRTVPVQDSESFLKEKRPD